MEVYALLALAGMGAWLNAQRKPVQLLHGAVPKRVVAQPNPEQQGHQQMQTQQRQYPNHRIVPGEQPSMTDLYNSTYSQKAAGIEAARAAIKFKMAQDPVATSVIGHSNSNDYNNSGNSGNGARYSARYSALAGVEIPIEEFTHNNMQPFYRGSLKQNVDPFTAATRLENLSGSISGFRSKREIETTQFFVPQPGNIFGAPNQTDAVRSFIVEPRARNNEFPIEREVVGPGIGAGFSAQPQDVYVAQREYAMPRSTDELRAANKPKLTFDARTLDGIKVSLGASGVGEVEKRTPETFKCNSQDDLLPTTGATLKEERRPDVVMLRDTSKPAMHTAYAGPAYLRKDKTLGAPQERASTAPHRHALGALNVGAATATDKWANNKPGADYGKSAIKIYTTLREVTEAKARVGNIGTAFKSLVTPLQDLVRIAKKETVLGKQREFGNVQPAIPAKMTIYDPNAVARTTLKEANLHGATLGNLKPNMYRITVYDPSDVARVTMRQTLQQEAAAGNLAPHRYTGQTYDPSDTARTTTKETTLKEALAGNLQAHRYAAQVHDPGAVARTTLKQTTLQESLAGNVQAHRYAAHVYDPNDIAKTTVKETALVEAQHANLAAHEYRAVQQAQDDARVTGRETLPDDDGPSRNLRGDRTAHIAYDPNDVAKVTLKEATLAEGQAANPDALQGRRGGYQVASTEAKSTQKQVLSDVEYYGQPTSEAADAYRTTSTEAKPTQKQVLSDIEYYGGLESSNKKASTMDQYVNARVNELRELVLEEREPVQQGAKGGANVREMGEVSNTRQLLSAAQDSDFANIERVDQGPSALTADAKGKDGCPTRARNQYRELDRLDDELLAQLQQFESNDVAMAPIHELA
jgi:hypothetical protein